MNTKNYLSIYAKSFNWAGFFLPKKTYLKCSNLYDFCRTVDNITDQDSEIEIKKQKLKEFKSNFENKNFDNSIIKNMWELMDEFKISKRIVDDLFDGVESDLKAVRIKNCKELIVYSYQVGGTVGLMMAKIFSVKKKFALKEAVELGTAMQYTNIIRDIYEDAKSDRIYLPQDLLEEEGVNNLKPKDIINLDKEKLKKIHKVIYRLTVESNYMYNSVDGIRELPFFSQFGILLAARLYQRIGGKILRDIEKSKKHYPQKKIFLNKFEKILATLHTFILWLLQDVVLQLIPIFDDCHYDRSSIGRIVNDPKWGLNLDEKI
tara:strand:- start:783 stop:1739 length:957 start_codon:yes stop_codon:yes gene_type:complete